jgi:hypothetical protein
MEGLADGDAVAVELADVVAETKAVAENEVVALVERDGVLLALSDALGVVDVDSDGVALAESEEVGVVDVESVGVALDVPPN